MTCINANNDLKLFKIQFFIYSFKDGCTVSYVTESTKFAISDSGIIIIIIKTCKSLPTVIFYLLFLLLGKEIEKPLVVFFRGLGFYCDTPLFQMEENETGKFVLRQVQVWRVRKSAPKILSFLYGLRLRILSSECSKIKKVYNNYVPPKWMLFKKK